MATMTSNSSASRSVYSGAPGAPGAEDVVTVPSPLPITMATDSGSSSYVTIEPGTVNRAPEVPALNLPVQRLDQRLREGATSDASGAGGAPPAERYNIYSPRRSLTRSSRGSEGPYATEASTLRGAASKSKTAQDDLSLQVTELKRQLELSRAQAAHLASQAKAAQIGFRQKHENEHAMLVAQLRDAEAQSSFAVQRCREKVEIMQEAGYANDVQPRMALGALEQNAGNETNSVLSDFQNSTMREESSQESLHVLGQRLTEMQNRHAKIQRAESNVLVHAQQISQQQNELHVESAQRISQRDQLIQLQNQQMQDLAQNATVAIGQAQADAQAQREAVELQRR